MSDQGAVTQQDQGITDTGSGHLAGVDPRQRPMTAAEWAAAQQAAANGQQQPPVIINTGQAPGQTFTADDIARARQDEKDKLYGRIEEMSGQLAELQTEREGRAAAEAAQREAEAAAERAKEEADLDTRQLLEQRGQEWETRFAALEQERDRERALREQEQRFAALGEYRRNRIDQEAQWIMPELRDLITGSTEEEVEGSIAAMKQRTEAILASVQGAVTQQRQQLRGAAVTAPPVGPMEQQTTFETLTPDDIRSMDMATYSKYRDRLLQAARPQQPR
jgi:hypothetical protein